MNLIINTVKGLKENILILVIIQNENGLILIFSNKVQHNYVVTFQNNLKNSQKIKIVQWKEGNLWKNDIYEVIPLNNVMIISIIKRNFGDKILGFLIILRNGSVFKTNLWVSVSNIGVREFFCMYIAWVIKSKLLKTWSCVFFETPSRYLVMP